MAKKTAKKTTKKRKYNFWTKEQIKELKVHSKAKTAVKMISKLMKRSETTLRAKAHSLGLSLGHRR